MRITETQLRRIIKEESQALREGEDDVEVDAIVESVQLVYGALAGLIDAMEARQESLARNGDGSRALDAAYDEVLKLQEALDGIEYLQSRESVGSDFDGEAVYAPVRRPRRR